MDMQRPTWATVVGVIGIILACFGILGAGQMVVMPKMLDMQKEMMTQMEKEIERQQARNPQQAPPPEMFKMFHRLWDRPEWYDTWCVVAGVVSLFIAGFYLFACIRILQTHPSAIGLFYGAAGVAIVFTLAKGIVAATALSFMGAAMMFWNLFGVVVNVVLFVVVGTGDKQAFAKPEE